MRPQSRWHPLFLSAFRRVGLAVGRWGHRPSAEPQADSTPEPQPATPVVNEQPTPEKVYGGTQTSYVTRLLSDGWLEVHVHHEARQVREQIRRLVDNPAALLRHEDAYGRSAIRAQYWLAQVMADHRESFRQNRVQFVFE
ncbi:MAG: hypothetical protein AAB289_13515 [Chloroflexota bacterium]